MDRYLAGNSNLRQVIEYSEKESKSCGTGLPDYIALYQLIRT